MVSFAGSGAPRSGPRFCILLLVSSRQRHMWRRQKATLTTYSPPTTFLEPKLQFVGNTIGICYSNSVIFYCVDFLPVTGNRRPIQVGVRTEEGTTSITFTFTMSAFFYVRPPDYFWCRCDPFSLPRTAGDCCTMVAVFSPTAMLLDFVLSMLKMVSRLSIELEFLLIW